MSYQNIQIALDNALKLVPSIPTIAWPNVDFNPVKGTSFVVPNNLPAKNELYTLSDREKYEGIYQVDIYVPTQTGTASLYTIADNIRTYFRTNNSLTKNSQTTLIRAVSLAAIQRDDAWYSASVEVHYFSFY